MIAKVKNFEVHCEPMTKFEYYDKIKKMQIQHFENKRINGFYCNWNGISSELMKLILISYILLRNNDIFSYQCPSFDTIYQVYMYFR